MAELFEASFVRFGRVSHVMQVLALHPSYLSRFSDAMHAIMYGSGPLPRPWRAYLAAMAGAVQHCPYVVKRQLEAFIADGGDPAWLAGLHAVPPKLRRLAGLNAQLALQPWGVDAGSIAALAAPDGDAMGVGELVHAVVILTAYHGIAALVWGMGVQPEIDWAVAATLGAPAPAGDAAATQVPLAAHTRLLDMPGAVAAAEGAAAPAAGAEDADFPAPPMPGVDVQEGHAELREQLLTAAAAAAELDGEAPGSAEEGASLPPPPALAPEVSVDVSAPAPAPAPVPALPAAGTPLPAAVSTEALPTAWREALTEGGLVYRDFKLKEGLFRTRDFSWSEHGFSTLSKYAQGVTEHLDGLFSHTYTLTYHTLGRASDLDTSPFRRAVWHMVHRLMGVTNDDYDYRGVNEFLAVRSKVYIKKLVTRPWTLTPLDYCAIVGGMTHAERCHVNLLATEAKKQCALLYALRAVGQHFS